MHQHSKADPIIGSALAVGSMTSVQLGAALAAPLMIERGSFGVTALRLAIAAVVLAIIVRPRLLSFTAAQWRGAFMFGAVMASMTLIYFEAVIRIPLGAATTIDFLGPLALAMAALKGWMRFALPLLAVIGVIAISYQDGAWVLDPIGTLYAFVAAFGWAAYIVTTRHVGQLFTAQTGLSVSLIIASAIALPVAFLLEPSSISVDLLLPSVKLALLVPLIPYSFEMMALRRLDMGVFSILMSLEPALGAITGYMLLDQSLTLQQILGIVAVMAASVIAVSITLIEGRKTKLPEPIAAD